MKKVKIILLAIILIMVLAITNNIYAVESDDENNAKSVSEQEDEGTLDKWTDFSKVKIRLEKTNSSPKDYSMYFDNVTFNKDSVYYVYLTHTTNEPKVESDSYGLPNNSQGIADKNGYSSTQNHINGKWMVESGDLYVWVLEHNINNSDKEKFVLSAKKVNRPELNDLDSRIRCSFFYDETYILIPEYNQNDDDFPDRKINIKIGQVDDNNILQLIKDGKKEGLDKLLEYSKKDKGKYETTISKKATISKYKALTSDMNFLNEGKYYYAYMYLDDESNKYIGVEDVSLYKPLITKNGSSLTNYLDSSFVWNLSTGSNAKTEKNDTSTKKETSDDKTIANKKIPFAGVNFIILTIILIVGITIFALYYQNKKYKDII